MNVQWQWYRVNPTTNSSVAIADARSASYTPVAAEWATS